MDQIWAPWRLGYIQGEDKSAAAREKPLSLLPGGDPDCFLCRAAVTSHDETDFVIDRGAETITLLNRYPYTNGHLLIAPKLHKPGLASLSPAEQSEILQKLTSMTGLLEQVLRAEGFNVGLNLGRVAGAGLPGHLHWHIVPRWSGDNNFMPTLAGVRVIPQSLEALWDCLRDALARGQSLR